MSSWLFNTSEKGFNMLDKIKAFYYANKDKQWFRITGYTLAAVFAVSLVFPSFIKILIVLGVIYGICIYRK